MIIWNFILINILILFSSIKCHNDIFKWHPRKVNELYIGGIFPMWGSWPGGQACLPSGKNR
jgi:hypothetical protein